MYIEDVLMKMLIVFILGLAPVAEVRGAIPLAFKFFMLDFGDSLLFLVACLWGILGNLIIAPIVLFALYRIDRFILNSKLVPNIIRKFYLNVLSYTRVRAKRYENIKAIGLMLYVAIPLPFTGAWTGSLIAYMLGLNKKKSLICIEIGVLIASAIVLIAIFLFTSLLRILGIEV